MNIEVKDITTWEKLAEYYEESKRYNIILRDFFVVNSSTSVVIFKGVPGVDVMKKMNELTDILSNRNIDFMERCYFFREEVLLFAGLKSKKLKELL